MNIQLATGDITDFTGDVIICPSDSDLTFKRIGIITKILEKAGKDLLKELTSIGFIEVGFAAIVQAYELKAKHLIFMPVADHNNEGSQINYVSLHQSLRAVFTIANLYKAKSVAIAGFRISSKRKNFLLSLWNKYFGDNDEAKTLKSDEIEDIIISTSKSLENSTLKELVIYKYSK